MISRKLKIHDALILGLIKPNEDGKAEGPIIDIVGTEKIEYYLEELVFGFLDSGREWIVREKYDILGEEDPMEVGYQEYTKKHIEISPDIIIKTEGLSTPELVAIEVETDHDFDFGKSLRQIKKYRDSQDIFLIKKNYRTSFDYVHIIIPSIYEDFAPLYKSQGFRVWLWTAQRKWQCVKCGKEDENYNIISIFKCEGCENQNKKSDHVLLGLNDLTFTIEEYRKSH